MIREPYIEANQHKTCTLCGLTDMPCAHIGQAWACFFCLRQALNQMIQAVSGKEKSDG